MNKVEDGVRLSDDVCIKIEKLASDILQLFASMEVQEVNDGVISLAVNNFNAWELVSTVEARRLLESCVYFPDVKEFEKTCFNYMANVMKRPVNKITEITMDEASKIADFMKMPRSKVARNIVDVNKYRNREHKYKKSENELLKQKYDDIQSKIESLRTKLAIQEKQIYVLSEIIEKFKVQYASQLFSKGLRDDDFFDMLNGDKRAEYYNYFPTTYECQTHIFGRMPESDKNVEGNYEERSERASLKVLCGEAEITLNKLESMVQALSKVIEDLMNFDLYNLVTKVTKHGGEDAFFYTTGITKGADSSKFWWQYIEEMMDIIEKQGLEKPLLASPEINSNRSWWGTIEDDPEPDAPTPGSRN